MVAFRAVPLSLLSCDNVLPCVFDRMKMKQACRNLWLYLCVGVTYKVLGGPEN